MPCLIVNLLHSNRAGRNRHGHDEESKSREKVAGVVVKRPLQALSVNNTSAFAVMGVDDEREKEIAANLKRVGEDISALLSMAKDIGLEVDVQNDQIKTIAGEVRCNWFIIKSGGRKFHAPELDCTGNFIAWRTGLG